MSAKNLSFKDLQCVVAIAECGSFSSAAAVCAITQPTLSERIKRVESQLGINLFERNTRVMKVTSEGEALIRKARELLDGVSEIDEVIASASEPLSGIRRIGVISTLGPYLVPYLLPRMRKQYPELDLVLHEGLTDSLITTLHAGSLDMVIAAAPLDTPGIETCTLFQEPFSLAIPKMHPLADLDVINAADLHGEEMVLLEDGHCLSGQALDVCPVKKRSNRHRLHATSLETVRQMVAAGAGYTLLPYLAVGQKPALTNLIRYCKIAGRRQYSRTIILAWRKSYHRDRDVSLFASLIRASLPKELQE